MTPIEILNNLIISTLLYTERKKNLNVYSFKVKLRGGIPPLFEWLKSVYIKNQKIKIKHKTKSTNQINLMKDKCCFSDQALHTTYNNFHIIWANKKLIKPKHQLHHCRQVSLCVLPHPLYQKVLYSLSLASIMQTAHNTLSPTQTPHRMNSISQQPPALGQTHHQKHLLVSPTK